MATVQTLAPFDIPGLHRSPNAEDFASSRDVYAKLCSISLYDLSAPPNAAKVPRTFFQELAEFLQLNNLTGLVALQVLDGPKDQTNTELLVGSQSTLMMNTKEVLGFGPAQITTGWSFQVGEGGIISCKGNDIYAPKKNTHGVFQDSKLLPTLEELKAVLLQEGIIA